MEAARVQVGQIRLEFLELTTREWQCHDQACGELNIRVRLGLFFETAPQMTDRFYVSK